MFLHVALCYMPVMPEISKCVVICHLLFAKAPTVHAATRKQQKRWWHGAKQPQMSLHCYYYDNKQKPTYPCFHDFLSDCQLCFQLTMGETLDLICMTLDGWRKLTLGWKRANEPRTFLLQSDHCHSSICLVIVSNMLLVSWFVFFC